MDFNYSPEDEAFRKEFRGWLQANTREHAAHARAARRRRRRTWKEAVAWHQKLNEGKWIGISWPKEYGGRGAGLLQNIIYHEELERAGTSVPFTGMGISLLGPTLIHWGTEEQKKRHLPKILAGRGNLVPGIFGTQLGIRPRRRCKPARSKTATDFVVNGQKVWTSIAQHADWIFLLVRTDPNAPKHKGISYLLVDMKSPGITVRPLVQITGGRGFNEVFFEDVRVPKKNIVGELNQGWQVAITTLMFERSGGSGEFRCAKCTSWRTSRKRDAAQRRQRVERASVRQKIIEFACDAEALKYTGYRQLTRQLKGHAARSRGLDDEAVQHRAAPADGDVRDGTAGAL